jgi:hypothetical protein
MNTDQKTCFKCGTEKPVTEYYKHKQMADGHLNKCKACTKTDVKAHRQDPRYRAKVLAYDRARGSRQSPGYIREWRRKNPDKYRAHMLVATNLKSPGVCSECDSTYHIEAHHDDYSKPLDVRWLCAACHKQHHAKAG